ncbi:hypothetical protein ACFYYM_30740 [Streptomyces erythrochromogenes]|uniref:hypothetical protein n=1 Tax=Streptomyces erythrochromogenes TaxID=285574 RepID=UPI0036C42DFE
MTGDVLEPSGPYRSHGVRLGVAYDRLGQRVLGFPLDRRDQPQDLLSVAARRPVTSTAACSRRDHHATAADEPSRTPVRPLSRSFSGGTQGGLK